MSLPAEARLTLVIAHRGASVARPENTIPAFQEARRLGADMVELDVRRTADGVLAVHHDPVVPGSGALITLPFASLIGEIPDLASAIDACLPMAVNVEVKNLPYEPDWDETETVAAGVASLVGERDLYDRILVSSFNPHALRRVHEVDGRVETALLTMPGWDNLAAVPVCVEAGHVALHPFDADLTPDVVTAAHDAGLQVNVWVVDDPDRMRQLADWGVDGICTNVPDVLLNVLGR